MFEAAWLYGLVGFLGSVSAFAVLLTSRRQLTIRTVSAVVLMGGLLSTMAVAYWYGGQATDNPWPAISLAIGIGMAQPKGQEIVMSLLSNFQIKWKNDE